MRSKELGMICILICLLVLNGILLSKFTYSYFMKAQRGFLNTTSKVKHGEENSSIKEMHMNVQNNIKVPEENRFTRLKRSIEPSRKMPQNTTEKFSNSSMNEIKKPPPDRKNYFTWDLNLNVSKYGKNFLPQKTKTADHAQMDSETGKNYLNMSLRMEGGGPRNYEALDNVWSSVGNLIRRLFKNESSSNESNDFDKNEQRQILDPKALEVGEMPQSIDENLGSFDTSANHSELLKTPNMINQELDDLTTMSQEGNDKESDSARKEGKFLFGLFEFGRPQSTESGRPQSTESGRPQSTESGRPQSTESGRPQSTESTEIDAGSGALRSMAEVSDLANASSEQFADVEGDIVEPFHEPGNLTNTLVSGIIEMPSEEIIPTESSILIPGSDVFQNLPKPPTSFEESTNTHSSFMGKEIFHDEICSDCDPSHEATDHSITETIVKEVAVFDLKVSEGHETRNEPIATEIALMKSEKNISTFGTFNKTVEDIDITHESSSESDLKMKLHRFSTIEPKRQFSTEKESCTDCDTQSFNQIIVDKDVEDATSKTNHELSTDSSEAVQNNENVVQQMSNINIPCSECIVSKNISLPSEMEKLNTIDASTTNFNETHFEKHCMELIDELGNARSSFIEISGRNSTVEQLNETQIQLFQFVANLINFIIANRNPSTQSISIIENNTSHDLGLNETEINQVRVLPSDLGALTTEEILAESNDLSESGTEISNSAFIAECDAFIRKKQIKENNKMFSKPNLMDIISDPNIRLDDFANATISPKLREQQLQFLTDLLKGNKNKQSSTEETMTEVPKSTEIEPHAQIGSSFNIEEVDEKNLVAETNKGPHQIEHVDNEASTVLLNGDDKAKRFFWASILNNIGLGSGERSINVDEHFSNETEFKNIEESEFSNTETDMKKKDERLFNFFEFASGVGRDLGENSEIDINTVVSTNETAGDENRSRFFFSLLGLSGSGDGRDLVQTDETETENKIQLSNTESIPAFHCEGNCTKLSDSIQARTLPSDVENESKLLQNETAFAVENVDYECLEDCSSEKLVDIKVNAHTSSNSDGNIDTLNETFVPFNSKNAEGDCENDTNSLIGNEKGQLNLNHSNSSEISLEDIDVRNFHDTYESSEINEATLVSEFESMITKSKFDGDFGSGVDSFSNVNHSITEIQETFSPNPKFPRRGRLDDTYDHSQVLERQPKRLDVEDEFRLSTSQSSEDGSWIDPMSKTDVSFEAPFQTKMPESVSEHAQVSEFHTSSVSTPPKVWKKQFPNIQNSTTKPNHTRCNSASECNILLNERCITSNKISICGCGRSFLRNEKTGMCEAKFWVETSVRLPGEVYSDALKDVSTERYKKMKEDSIQMMWYLLAENPELARIIADIDVIGFSQGSLVIHWSITLHPPGNNSRKEMKENMEHHLRETLRNETIIRSAPLDLQSAALISRAVTKPCKIRDLIYCSENAICKMTDLEGGYTCECKMNMVDRSINQKFPGEICEEKCPDNYCGLHGVCQWQNSVRICLCSGWYLGEKCDLSAAVVIAAFAVVNFLLLSVITSVLCFWKIARSKVTTTFRNESSRRITEVIAMEPASVYARRYADIVSPKPGPSITVTAPSDQSTSYDGDSTFDTSHASDVSSGVRGDLHKTFIV